jgi:hypothetical protein
VTPVLGNVFVGAAGSCSRSAAAVGYSAASSCGSFQAACDAAAGGDTVGVEPGSYPNVVIGNCGNGGSGPAITFRPDNGVVTFLGSTSNDTALQLGPVTGGTKTPVPPHWLTFDGGAGKDFHTGSGTLPGHVYIGSSGPPQAAADHITIANFVVCDKCPDPGGDADLQVTADTNVTIAANQIGPACCGNTCEPTCGSSTTPNGSPTLIIAGGGQEGDARNITITGNTLYGVTDNAGGEWSTSALGPPPQNACTNNDYCHDDCAHFNSGLVNLVVTDNAMYNCYAQGIFIEDDEGDGIVNGVTIENNYVDSPSAAIGALLNAAPDTGAQGTWIFAFNTTSSGIGMSRTGTGPGFSLAVIGNYGNHSFQDDGGNDMGCGWKPQNGTLTIDYNAWHGAGPGSRRCGANDASPGSALRVVDAGDWGQNDLGTNFDLSGTSIAIDRVPAQVCRSYVTADIHGNPRPTTGSCDAGADQGSVLTNPMRTPPRPKRSARRAGAHRHRHPKRGRR